MENNATRDAIFRELQAAHSHYCPECESNWGCLTDDCTRGHRVCPNCEPQVVRCEQGMRWRLQFERIERIEIIRMYCLRLHYRDDDRRPVIANQQQVSNALLYLAGEVGNSSIAAQRLWNQMRGEALKN